jgi:hypothetical protein
MRRQFSDRDALRLRHLCGPAPQSAALHLIKKGRCVWQTVVGQIFRSGQPNAQGIRHSARRPSDKPARGFDPDVIRVMHPKARRPRGADDRAVLAAGDWGEAADGLIGRAGGGPSGASRG